MLVENKAGVLARVAGLFARRGFNIYSLAVAPTDDERFSRITIVVDVESTPLEQITKQLFKLINVVKISELDPADAVERELMMVTVKAEARAGARSSSWCRCSRAASSTSATEPSPSSWPVRRRSSTTSRTSCGAIGITQLQRTGRVALPRLERQPHPTRLRRAG